MRARRLSERYTSRRDEFCLDTEFCLRDELSRDTGGAREREESCRVGCARDDEFWRCGLREPESCLRGGAAAAAAVRDADSWRACCRAARDTLTGVREVVARSSIAGVSRALEPYRLCAAAIGVGRCAPVPVWALEPSVRLFEPSGRSFAWKNGKMDDEELLRWTLFPPP